MNGRAYHDTYHVVAPLHALAALLGATVLLLLCWLAISRLAPGAFRRTRRLAAIFWIAGLGLMAAVPLVTAYLPADLYLERPAVFLWLNTASSVAAALLFAATVLTLGLLGVALMRRFSSRDQA